MEPILKLQDVSVNFSGLQALTKVTFDSYAGEVRAVIGPNGAGKTTLFNAISGYVGSTEGTIYFKGTPIHKMPTDKIVAMGLVQVPEGRRIFPNMSVLENLEMGTFLRRDKSDIQKDIDYAFDLFPILAQRRTQLGGTLSGGEQQMLAISRALMARPRVLLLDEPSLGLAPLIIKQIFEIIKKINQEQKTTVFLVEQNANQALKLADRGYVMENGRITLTDTAEKLLDNEQVKEAYLGL